MHGEGAYKGIFWLGISRAAQLPESSHKHFFKEPLW